MGLNVWGLTVNKNLNFNKIKFYKFLFLKFKYEKYIKLRNWNIGIKELSFIK